MEAHDDGGQVEGEVEVQIPSELEGGTYANFLSVWHTGHEFTLDFGTTQPPEPRDHDDPEAGLKLPVRTVARIKIPPTLIFAVLQALNTNMARYEETFGEIRRPEA